MQTVNEGRDGMNAALTSTLIRTILESRRAIRMAMAMMQELMQTGTVADWLDESSPRRRSLSLPGAPKLELHHGSGTFALKRKSTSRTPLRLVSPFRHDSPLVMPGDSRLRDADEHVEERRDRGDPERAEEEPRKATESEALH